MRARVVIAAALIAAAVGAAGAQPYGEPVDQPHGEPVKPPSSSNCPDSASGCSSGSGSGSDGSNGSNGSGSGDTNGSGSNGSNTGDTNVGSNNGGTGSGSARVAPGGVTTPPAGPGTGPGGSGPTTRPPTGSPTTKPPPAGAGSNRLPGGPPGQPWTPTHHPWPTAPAPGPTGPAKPLQNNQQLPTGPTGAIAPSVPFTDKPSDKQTYDPLDATMGSDPDATGTIGEIRVDKNTKTNDDTVAYIAKIEVGDEWTRDMVDQVKIRLVSSGLFKDVDIFWGRRKSDGKIVVTLMVEDKHSWIIAPAFYNQPTNTGGGVGFGENNLFGTGQKLLIYAQYATGDTFFIGAWQLPQISGSRFHAQFDTYLASQRNYEYAAPRKYLDNPIQVRESKMLYLNGGARIGIDLFKGVKFDVRLRGAKVSYKPPKLVEGATPEMVGVEPGMDIPKPGKEGWDVSNEYALIVDRRANWYGVQSGYRLQASFEMALPKLGSDFEYRHYNFSWFRAWQVLERHNFIVRGGFQYGENLPFQQEYLMGGTSHRGLLNNQYRGDLKIQSNVEYSAPVFTVMGFGVRALAFFDSGYTTFRDTDNETRNYLPGAAASGAAPFKNSIGVGTRFYLRQIVLPLLGLDVGYGLEGGDLQVYLAIGLTD